MSEVTLDDVAEQLYAADPARFIALREGFAKQARAQQDRDLVKQIKALRRPTVSAWLVNMAVRHLSSSMAALTAVATKLRAAQEALDGPAMKQLTAERGEVERRLLAEIDAWAREHEQAPTPATMIEVQHTLRAAVGDAEAGTAVQSGRLTRSLSYAGFGGVDLADAVAVPDAVPPRRLRVVPDAPAEPDAQAERPAPAERVTDDVEAAAEPLPEPAEPESAEDEDDDDLDQLAAAAQAQLEAAQHQLAQVQARKALRTATVELAAARRAVERSADVVNKARSKIERLTAELERADLELTAALEQEQAAITAETAVAQRIEQAQVTLEQPSAAT